MDSTFAGERRRPVRLDNRGPITTLLGMMSTAFHRFVALWPIVISAVVQTGCVSQSESYPGHSADQVWTAMLAVARTPDYNDPDSTERWTVRENEVWVDDEGKRIEIFRRLERMLYQPASQPQHEAREWRFEVVLEQDDPPEVEFSARGFSVPAHSWKEADRYFDEVWNVLGGKPPEMIEAEAAAAQPKPQAEPPPAYDQ